MTLITTVERKDFEDAAADFFDKVMIPVNDALSKANLKVEDIDQVELLGGGIRVPKIQEILSE